MSQTIFRNISATKLCYFAFFLCIFQYHVADAANSWTTKWEFDSSSVCNKTDNCMQLHMTEKNNVTLTIGGVNTTDLKEVRLVSDSDILEVSTKIDVNANGDWKGTFETDAVFIGKANVYVEVVRNHGDPERSDKSLLVVIIRKNRLIDTLFIISVASLVSILYINFGAALDMKKVKNSLRRPIGPLIAFFCHFVFLPLSAYGLGLLLFPNSPEMQLGLFFTGASPAGGASNTWTVILGGNLDLSITMSTTSTLSAFAMTPLWVFTLGKTIFDRGNMAVPYSQIASSVFGLIIPLAIGLLIQRYCPRITRFLVRILKACSSLLIIFIVVFAIVTNLYLFKLFTWEIILAGLLLPWLGYFVGWLAAVICRREYEDRLAIAVEAGIQNTGIAIFVLRSALDQPEADLTTVLPVSVAIMTPFPLMAFYLCLKTREWLSNRRSGDFPAEIKECIQSQESGVY